MAIPAQVREALVRVCGEFREMAPALARLLDAKPEAFFAFDLDLTPVQGRIMRGALERFPEIGEIKAGYGRRGGLRICIRTRVGFDRAVQVARIFASTAYVGARQGIMQDLTEYKIAKALVERLESQGNY